MAGRLVVSVRPDGSVTAETVGVTGEKCLGYIDVLEELLEATATDSRFTPDYYEAEVTHGPTVAIPDTQAAQATAAEME